MKRCVLPIVLVCMIATGGESRGETEQRAPKKKRGSEHSGASDFGHKVEHAFLSVGGHLQKFFTGRDTITR